jgi:hypothetical protein
MSDRAMKPGIAERKVGVAVNAETEAKKEI